jgi:hypothetical protein
MLAALDICEQDSSTEGSGVACGVATPIPALQRRWLHPDPRQVRLPAAPTAHVSADSLCRRRLPSMRALRNTAVSAP